VGLGALAVRRCFSAVQNALHSPRLVYGTTLVGRFVIEGVVGAGGMAVVYRARDLTTQAQVAVKLLHGDTRSDFIQDHFLHEAQILSTLRHPHIVSYIAHGSTANGEAYLAMEWLEGEDLEQRLRRGPLSLAEALRLIEHIAAALRETHARGIVHRDIKPSNLFLRHKQIDQVMLLDFGVARQLGGSAGLTRTGAIIGTPEYMAPEQMRGDRSVGPAADIFALGCVLHECLSGQPPFFGEQIVAVLAKILFEPPSDIQKARPGIPNEVMDVLGRMLAKTTKQICSA
jgi:serine/threonine protein kinase